jgi:hypothetical protein
MYRLDVLIGMSMSFIVNQFNKNQFSTYFEGYGLSKDVVFSLRALSYSQNYIHPRAQFEHYHESLDRPNNFKCGLMVIRNGCYVWLIKYTKSRMKTRIKWNATSFLLTLISFSNVIKGDHRKAAFTETTGRTIGWFSILVKKPKIK